MAYFRCVGGVGGGAVLTLTYSSDFYGVDITATNGTETHTITATSSGEVVFNISEAGTWTISATVDGQTYSETVNVTLEYTSELIAIPDGSTVTPVNSIPIWLKCAMIRDKSYTTLSQVLADTETFIALCADSNASDYMARSTTWASGVTADATAMQIVGKYGYCANALRNDNTWNTAINNSPYASYVPVSPIVPTGTVLHSAVEDTTYYVSGGSNVPFCTIASGDTETVLASTIESLKNQTITLYSSVAKDPTNLSNDFTMPVRITPNITEIYLMPLKSLYWWGHKSAFLEDCTSANGWSYTKTLLTPTYNSSNILLSTGNNACAVSTKTAMSGNFVAILTGTTASSGVYGWWNGETSKSMKEADQISITSGTITKYAKTISNKYPVLFTVNSRAFKVHAIWIE